MKLFPLLSACLLALAPSCFIARDKVNTPLDPEKITQLVPGTSTADDVIELLGAPNDVVQLAKRSAWRYDHSEGKRAAFTVIIVTLVNSDLKQDRVWVFFDENDVLTHVSGTFEAGEVEYKMPFQD